MCLNLAKVRVEQMVVLVAAVGATNFLFTFISSQQKGYYALA
jgi:hypothetical protein